MNWTMHAIYMYMAIWYHLVLAYSPDWAYVNYVWLMACRPRVHRYAGNTPGQPPTYLGSIELTP